MTREEIAEAKREITEEIRAVWDNCPESFPLFLQENPAMFPVMDARRKKENEVQVQEFVQRMQKKFRQKPADEERLAVWEKSLERDFMEFLGRERIICAAETMGKELLEEFVREAKRFIDRVRAFDGELDQAQIWQAFRNYLIYAVIVDMQGERQNAGDQILAYSLLYPYTDNYIDNEKIPKECKEHYNRMIADKLRGGSVTPRGLLEERTCLLLDMILRVCSEPAGKRVSGILLQLLYAQSSSIGGQLAEVSGVTSVPIFSERSQDRILETSIWKGSTSVVADYLFSTPHWTQEEETFYRKFGFLLQMIDDLQDIEEDKRSGNRTLMAECRELPVREKYVNRLLWYSWRVITEFEPVNPRLKEFILKNCVAIILDAVCVNAQFFSKAYLETLKPYLLFSAEFLRKTGKRQKKSQIQMGG